MWILLSWRNGFGLVREDVFGRECVAKYYKERAVLTQLPFATSFDPGWGPRTVTAGKVVSEDRYFNMSRQDVQPSFLRAKPAAGDCATTSLALSHEHALNGSAAVQLTFAFSESRMLSGTFAVLRLFIANVSFPKQQYHNMPHAAAAFSSPDCLRISYQYFVDDDSTAALRPSRPTIACGGQWENSIARTTRCTMTPTQ